MRNAAHTINEIAKIISLVEDDFLRRKFPTIGSGSQLRALIAISEFPNSTPSGIASRIGITKASVTGLSTNLLKAKLIEEKPNPKDKRSHFLRLTKSGSALLKRVVPKHEKIIEAVLPDAATEKKLNTWFRALKPESTDR